MILLQPSQLSSLKILLFWFLWTLRFGERLMVRLIIVSSCLPSFLLSFPVCPVATFHSTLFFFTTGTRFLKHARDMSDKLGLSGWIKLSRRSTVIGTVQGEKGRVDEMALWLRLQGSPGSRIDHTDFSNWKIIERRDYKTFSMRF